MCNIVCFNSCFKIEAQDLKPIKLFTLSLRTPSPIPLKTSTPNKARSTSNIHQESSQYVSSNMSTISATSTTSLATNVSSSSRIKKRSAPKPPGAARITSAPIPEEVGNTTKLGINSLFLSKNSSMKPLICLTETTNYILSL